MLSFGFALGPDMCNYADGDFRSEWDSSDFHFENFNVEVSGPEMDGIMGGLSELKERLHQGAAESFLHYRAHAWDINIVERKVAGGTRWLYYFMVVIPIFANHVPRARCHEVDKIRALPDADRLNDQMVTFVSNYVRNHVGKYVAGV